MSSTPPPNPTSNSSQGPDMIASLLKTSPLSLPVRTHLSRIYSTLGYSTVVASAGALIHIYNPFSFIQGGLLSLMTSIGSLLMLSFVYPFIRGDPSRAHLRLGIFLLFSLTYGMSLGPFLENIMSISSDAIVPTTLLLTSLIFISFSASAIYSQRRSFLFLGGILAGSVSVLTILGLLNIFFGSELLFNIDIYAGLLIFSGFLLFDTQMIIERVETATAGQVITNNTEHQYDTIQDSLQLFLDVVAIFIRLAIILSKNSGNKNNQHDKEDKQDRRKRHHMRG